MSEQEVDGCHVCEFSAVRPCGECLKPVCHWCQLDKSTMVTEEGRVDLTGRCAACRCDPLQEILEESSDGEPASSDGEPASSGGELELSGDSGDPEDAGLHPTSSQRRQYTGREMTDMRKRAIQGISDAYNTTCFGLEQFRVLVALNPVLFSKKNRMNAITNSLRSSNMTWDQNITWNVRSQTFHRRRTPS